MNTRTRRAYEFLFINKRFPPGNRALELLQVGNNQDADILELTECLSKLFKLLDCGVGVLLQ
jgi:hypothetical protein